MTLDEALAASPIVAIVRGIKPHEILETAQAYFEAGLRAVEVPLNSPEPLESIRRLALEFGDRMVCGAGTVLDPASVEAVADAGGRLIVSPNTRADVVARTVALGMEAAPGFATATEAFTCIDAGARHLKLFPASTYGPGHVRQLKAVLPAAVAVLAVGGVKPDSMADWWAAGCRGYGLGSELYKPGQSADESFEKARRAVEAAATLRS
jgi:2-dehydro-3-deoxyphosphogalactonate aldolase